MQVTAVWLWSSSSNSLYIRVLVHATVLITCIVLYVYFCISFYFPHLHVGIPPQPLQFYVSVSSTNTTLAVSWVAPPSLEVSTPPTISHYVLGNNVTNITKTISNPSGCRPSVPCNSSLDLSDPSLMIHNGEQNTTILDYNGTILFTFFAVNGAGNGNSSSFIYTPLKSKLKC